MSGGNNGKVLTVSRKLAKTLTDSRKSHHPIETLYCERLYYCVGVRFWRAQKATQA